VQPEAGLIDVLFALTPRALLLDVAGPAESLRLVNQHHLRAGRPARFRLRFTGASAELPSSVGLSVTGLELFPERFESPTWVVLVGQPSETLASPVRAVHTTASWLGRYFAPALSDEAAGHRLVTICSGTLLAARAGLLGSHRCTTHHEMLDELRALAPDAQVVDNRVFVVDGPIASSAGVTAGIDLALHLVAQTCGDGIAASVAKDMVVYLRRTPNDPELSPMLAHRHHLHPAVHRVQDAVSERPTEEWDMASLCAVAHVTERHLQRLFAEHAGVSPLHYLERIRLEHARRSLINGASVTQAASVAGFSSDLQLRRAWGRHLPGSPRDAGNARATDPASPDLRRTARH
jgi:transcriptional regulator GlxA family with amidase domain